MKYTDAVYTIQVNPITLAPVQSVPEEIHIKLIV